MGFDYDNYATSKHIYIHSVISFTDQISGEPSFVCVKSEKISSYLLWINIIRLISQSGL